MLPCPAASESPLSPGGLCCPVLSIYSGGVGCPGSFFCAASSLLPPHGLRVWRRGFQNQRRAAPLSARRAAPRTQKTAASPSTESQYRNRKSPKARAADAAPIVNKVLGPTLSTLTSPKRLQAQAHANGSFGLHNSMSRLLLSSSPPLPGHHESSVLAVLQALAAHYASKRGTRFPWVVVERRRTGCDHGAAEPGVGSFRLLPRSIYLDRPAVVLRRRQRGTLESKSSLTAV